MFRDAEGRPFQLLSVKNLRASLANRLGQQSAEEKTRSIAYRQVVRQVSYRRVDSTAEAEWVYAQIAAELFPAAYRKMIDSWGAWYVSINPEDKFPHWVVTERPEWKLARTTFGPIPTKSGAQKYVEMIEDAFDLCRYHHILVQAPHGQACSYKQMNKCPAPCDGSISMDVYRRQVELSISAIGNRQMIAEHEQKMREAAAGLKFEEAGRIKAHVEQLKHLIGGSCELVRPVSAMRFVAVLRGAKAKAWKLMLLTPEKIELMGELVDVQSAAPVIAQLAACCERGISWTDADRLTFIARQIMLRSSDCVLTSPSMEAVKSAANTLCRRKSEPESKDEGVVQEAG